MKVLFAVDGSVGSFDAISQVAPLLKHGQDEVAIYCSPPQVRLRSSAVSDQLIPAALAALAAAIFAEAVKHLPAVWQSSTQQIVGTQDARRGILIAAQQTQADLIVVGARGLNRLERLLLGSVSRTIVQTSPIPVWVARPRTAAANGPYHIVLACKSPENARPPIDLLSQLNWPTGSSCCALAVVISIFAGQVPAWLEQQARSPDVDEMARHWVREHDEELQDNLAKLRGLIAQLPSHFPPTQPQVVEGEPAEQILAAIVRERTDLVVVGVPHQRHRIGEVFGSTSDAVLNHAHCSVLVMPHRQAP